MAWKHFLIYCPFVWGIHRSVEPIMRSFDVFFIFSLDKLLNKGTNCCWRVVAMTLMWRMSEYIFPTMVWSPMARVFSLVASKATITKECMPLVVIKQSSWRLFHAKIKQTLIETRNLDCVYNSICSLQWRQMNMTTSQMICGPNACLTVCFTWHPQWVMFPWHDFIMSLHHIVTSIGNHPMRITPIVYSHSESANPSRPLFKKC